MNKTLLETIRIIFTIITVIMIAVSGIMLIIKLTWHSPSETTIMFSVIGILLTLQVVIISIVFQIKEDIGNFKEFKRQTIEKIRKIEIKIV